MGVTGLLQYFKSVERDTDISKYRGKRLAVDGHSWIHKAIYGSGYNIVVKTDYTKCLKSILARIDVLINFGIYVVLVLDGADLPAKLRTEIDRAAQRKLALAAGYEEMEFVITSPYEADAQLAYLSRTGYVDGIITEDSDLLLFGARKMIFKLGPEYTGKELDHEDIFETKDIDFKGWSHEKFIQCCILAGCDYLKNPKGIAVKTAHALFEKFHTIQNILSYLKQRPVNPVDDQYVFDFERAFLTFKYQRVWCPIKRQVVTLNNIEFERESVLTQLSSKSLSKDLAEISALCGQALEKELLLKHFKDSRLFFLGPVVAPEIALELAEGRLDPGTHQPFEDFEFIFDPRELCVEEIENLGYRKISELLNPNKKKFVMPDPEDRLFLNLTLEFDEDLACNDDERQRKLDEAAKKDPVQALLKLLISPGKKATQIGGQYSTTVSANGKSESPAPSPLRTRNKGLFSSASKASQLESAVNEPSSADECLAEGESGETAPDEVYSLRKRTMRLRRDSTGVEEDDDLKNVCRKMNFNHYLPEDKQVYTKTFSRHLPLPSKESGLQSLASKMKQGIRSKGIQDIIMTKRMQILSRMENNKTAPSTMNLSIFGGPNAH